jgi:GWxTD domain-containing protein
MKHYRSFIVFFLSLTIGLALASCKTPARLSYRNIASFYNPASELKGLDYACFNVDDSLTRLYVSFPYNQLKYTRENGLDLARFRLSYQLYDGYDNSTLIDSSSFYGLDSLKADGRFFDSIALKTYRGRNYMLNVELHDLVTEKHFGRFLAINKNKTITPNDFLLVGNDNIPLLRNYVLRNETFRVRTNIRADEMKISYSGMVFPPSTSPYQPSDKPEETVMDSLFTINLVDGVSGSLRLSATGSYFIRQGDISLLLAHRFYDGFPEIGAVEKMRESLRYITTDAEYRELQTKPARVAVDDFWIKVTGHPERALQQIKRYYTRLEEANRFFTLAFEGWKSDRGMIYIVYGPPSVVYKNALSEEWTYGEAGNPLSVRFLFSLEPIQDNKSDFVLERSEAYRTSWHLAVSNWRR